MANLIEVVKTIVENINEKPETKNELSTLRKEIAEKVVEKFEAEQGDLFLSMGKDVIADYLVDEGWTDKLHDALVEKGLDSLITSAPQLKEIREKLNKAKTSEELRALETEILAKSSVEVPPEVEGHHSDSVGNKEGSLDSKVMKEEKNLGNVEAGKTSHQSSFGVLLSDQNKEKGFDADKVVSAPFQRSATGTTLCSKTAQNNALQFGFTLPSGNAFDAAAKVPKLDEYKITLPENKTDERPSELWSPLKIEDFYQLQNVNVADIYPNASRKNKHYGHRAIAFKNQEGQRMVLDPYVSIDGFGRNDPKPLDKYMERKNIYKGHFFAALKYERKYA